jgi:hypothetical protein
MDRNMQIARRLAPVQKVGMDVISKGSSVIKKKVYQAPLQKPSTVRVTLNAPGGAGDKLFIIGDRTGLIAGINDGLTFVEPTSANVPVEALKTFLGKRTLVGSMNIAATVSAASLNNNPKLLSAEIDGTSNSTQVDLSSAVRNDAQNDKLLTVDLSESPVLFDDNNAMSILVPEGETITITFSIAGVDR